jgi:hypothetical protein
MGTEEERRPESRAGELINYLSIYGIELELNSPEKERRRRDGSARARASRRQVAVTLARVSFSLTFQIPNPKEVHT